MSLRWSAARRLGFPGPKPGWSGSSETCWTMPYSMEGEGFRFRSGFTTNGWKRVLATTVRVSRPYICDRFYRPDRSRQRGTGGTGLGLAIVKSLVESMNGRLVIESQPGRGTTITLDLPCSENVQGRRLLYPGEKTAEAQCKSS